MVLSVLRQLHNLFVMATIKVKFSCPEKPGAEGTVYYQVIHEKKSRRMPTDYRVLADEWSEKRQMVVTTQKSVRRDEVLAIREKIRQDVERINKIVYGFEMKGLIYTVDDVVEEFNRCTEEYSLFNFMEKVIARLKQNGKVRTAETYRSALMSLRKFNAGDQLMLDSVTPDTMECYEGWLRGQGKAANTVSFYTRIVRAVYNRAVEQGIIEDRHPFRRVYTGVDKTVKRALPLRILKKIKTMDLSDDHELDFARDMFMLSFYLRGMSFIDMAYLRKSDRKSGYVVYRRRKTGQLLTIKWTEEMAGILKKYPENTTEYLFPILRRAGRNERYAYRNVAYSVNKNLKKIAEKIDLSVPLTLYVARHSWASVARQRGVPVSVISEGMGHDSEMTTHIYLASLDNSVVDNANRKVMKALE